MLKKVKTHNPSEHPPIEFGRHQDVGKSVYVAFQPNRKEFYRAFLKIGDFRKDDDYLLCKAGQTVLLATRTTSGNDVGGKPGDAEYRWPS